MRRGLRELKSLVGAGIQRHTRSTTPIRHMEQLITSIVLQF